MIALRLRQPDELLARLTPTSFHKYYNRKRGREASDTFETHYRANTVRRIMAIAKAAGFRVEEFRVIEGRPEYLRIHPALYCLGLAYERIVNSSELFSLFRVVIIGVLSKP